MEFESLYYFLELSKRLHMTQTASQLFISQQTLSNRIQRLEEYYGAKLFNRKPSLSLTYAGEKVASFAEQLLKQEKNLKDILTDINKHQHGLLRFGASTLRMNTCLPRILPLFSSKFPNIEIRVTDTISSQLENMVITGDLDIAIVLDTSENSQLNSYHLMDDQIFLCVADELLSKHYGKNAEKIKERARHQAYVKDFAKLSFCILSNRMGHLIMKCFNEVPYKPKPYITTTFTQISLDICYNQLAACFASSMNFANQNKPIPKGISIFPLYSSQGPMIQKLNLIVRKDHYISEPAQFFIEILLDAFSEIERGMVFTHA